MNSREKVEHFLRAQAEDAPAGNMLAASAVAMLPMILANLPEQPEVLDEVLGHYAVVLVHLRSDDAPALHVAEGPAPASAP